jgi:cyclophilin family peptidyl-prolyl cis-trans isomerase
VVRFETSVGSFDMVLNPTDNPLLEGHVQNMLQYVEDERYRANWINRADTGFVLQMGGFYSHTLRPPATMDSIRPVLAFDPVVGFPGIPDLSNTVGTVSLALPSDASGPLEDEGSNSFFINLRDNSGLDADFTVFAAIPDMTVVNQIMALQTIDRTTDPTFGAGPGNLAFTDVPVQADGKQVFVRRAFVVTDAMTIASATAAVAPVMAHSASAGGAAATLLASANAVPEPASACLAAFAGLLLTLVGRCRRR